MLKVRAVPPAWPSRAALLSATALVTWSLPALAADTTVDGGSTETVIGGGGGTQASPWDVNGDLIIGDTSTGTVEISNGGSVEADFAVLGDSSSGDGTLAITGSGSDLFTNDDLVVGGDGTGTVSVLNGGTLDTDDGVIAAYDGSMGTVTVSGNGSTWTVADRLFVGNTGTGDLTVSNGGTITVPDAFAILGSNTGSTGTVNLLDANSLFHTEDDLIIGDDGTGIFTATNGSMVRVDSGDVQLADGSGGDGTLTLDGSGTTMTVTAGDVSIGNDGTGHMTLSNGATLTNDESYIGEHADSTGTARVMGSGSFWSMTSDLNVGRDGTGTLTLDSGGHIVVGDDLRVGRGTDGIGVLTVTGPGTALTVSDQASVGYDGNGTVTLSDNASLTSDTTYIGQQAGSTGVLTVTGPGSTWTSTGDVVVGLFGTGTLTVSNSGTIEGNEGVLGAFSGSSGMATVTGSGSVWSSSGDLYIANTNTGTLVLSDRGMATVGGGRGTVNLSPDTNAVGTLIIGAPSNASPSAPGFLNAGTVLMGPGSATLVFNHTAEKADGYLFGANVTGDGAIESQAGYTILSGELDHTGGTTIYGGTLAVNGTIGDVTLAGGAVGGSGTIGRLLVTQASTIAPGNSIGTLTVSSDLTLPSGSTYAVEVDSQGNADRLVVGGRLSLDNDVTLSISPEIAGEDGSTYTPSTTYTIASADSVSGTFGTITEPFVFLDPFVAYGDTSITLTLIRNDTPFSAVGQTPNQIAAAGGVESLGTSATLYQAVAKLSEPAVRDAFDQLSGEIHATAIGTALDDSRFARDMALARLETLAERPPVEPGDRDLQVWVQGHGAWGDWRDDAGGGAARARSTRGGLFIGADMALSPKWRVGVMTGYDHLDLSVDDRHSDLTSDIARIGAYGGGPIGPLDLRFGVSYAIGAVETERTVSFTGISDSPSASYTLGTAQAFGALSHTFTRNNGATHHRPFFRVASVTTHAEDFTESGGVAALSSDGSVQTITFTRLGLASDHRVMIGGTSLTARGDLAWRHAFGGTEGQAKLALANGDSFTVNGVSIPRDAAVLGAGLDATLSDQSHLTLGYTGLVSKGSQGHSVMLSLTAKF